LIQNNFRKPQSDNISDRLKSRGANGHRAIDQEASRRDGKSYCSALGVMLMLSLLATLTSVETVPYSKFDELLSESP
jgi:hypothetical protein